MQQAEGVGETAVEQHRHLLALLIGEARVVAVGLGIFDIDLLVCHVHIATDDDRFLIVECQKEVPEVVLPLHAVVKTA